MTEKIRWRNTRFTNPSDSSGCDVGFILSKEVQTLTLVNKGLESGISEPRISHVRKTSSLIHCIIYGADGE